jgi:hypothetical protein
MTIGAKPKLVKATSKVKAITTTKTSKKQIGLINVNLLGRVNDG